jgi:NAD+ synthase
MCYNLNLYMRAKIVRWLRKQVKSARAKGIVLGLSGGIDSCVVAALAKEALGASKVLALYLPCRSQSQDELDARLCSRVFGVPLKTVDLSKVYDALAAVLPAADRMTQANIRPRLRMIVLYYYARKLGYLVCGTSNKSELSAGYFTKHGDGASDLLPLGGLLKTQVRRLAQELGIPQRIIDKAPTAGLWPGQTDEAEMGISYAELDAVIDCLERGIAQKLCAKKVAKVKRMIASSEHKRRPAPLCPFGPRGIGF